MKILRADHLGFCFGVRDALALAKAEAARSPSTVLGELVHNQTVLDELNSHGVQVERNLDAVSTKKVVITAHGVSRQRMADISNRNLEVVDATCPLVRHAHQELAQLVARGFHPIVIGQQGHVEVLGLTEDYPECNVIISEADVDALASQSCFGVVAQTTQPTHRVQLLLTRLRERFPTSQIEYRDTVCQPTKLRQTAAEELASACDVVIVIGGANSNNTRELVATCRRLCGRVYHVQVVADLKIEWIGPDDTVGITAGTSTPNVLIDRVEHALIDIDRCRARPAESLLSVE